MVKSVVISRDSQTIVSGSHDGTVRLWNAQTGTDIRVLKGHTGGVCSVVISGDSQKIVSGSRDKTVRLWNT